MLILHPGKPELTYTTYVRMAAKNARLVAPMQKRYAFCFDISELFSVFASWYDKGLRNDTMPIKLLRAHIDGASKGVAILVFQLQWMFGKD